MRRISWLVSPAAPPVARIRASTCAIACSWRTVFRTTSPKIRVRENPASPVAM